MDDHTSHEQAYQNGKEYMRQCILEKLYTAKGTALGIQRVVLSAVIEMVQNLEVRP